MKKLALITLTALVCLCLVGCTEDTITPNEPAEAVTPNEVIEQPVVTPNEPETPAEPEATEKPEENSGAFHKWNYVFKLDENEKNVVIQPYQDGNTAVYDIGFPTYFPLDYYSTIAAASVEDFEWGDYYPVVSYITGNPKENTKSHIVDYAVLSPSIKNLEEGVADYEALLGKHKKTESFLSPSNHYRSNEDLDESIKHTHHSWIKTAKYRILQDGMGKEPVKQNVYIYSSLDMEPTYKIKYDFRNEYVSIDQKFYVTTTYFDIVEFINDRYLFFTISNYDELLEKGKAISTSNFYRFDIETGELSFIEKYVYSSACSISPDGKYLIYTFPVKNSDGATSNNLDAMGYGFYIKNIETNKTVFYKYDYTKYNYIEPPYPFYNSECYAVNIIGWIQKDLLKD